MANDFYEVLGVAKDASAEDIKRAYRRLSKELHPDKHKGEKAAEERYKKVNEAYEVLSDPQKRQMYDQFGESGLGGQGAGPFGAGAGGFGGFDFSAFTGGERIDFSDLFEGFFGGGARRRGPPHAEQGADREVEITIDLAEAVTGARKTVTLRTLRSCSECGGSGARKGSSLVTCTECGGTGEVVKATRSFFGTLRQSAVCTKCRGSGKVPEHPCGRCGGEGRVAHDTSINFTIPAGIDDGQVLRLRGEGDAGRQGGGLGDLFVRVRVTPHPRIRREGSETRSEIAIPIPDALLGTEMSVETVHGPVTLKIPAGTQSQQVFRLRGKGMPVLNTNRFGDHYVQVTVEIPSKLSREERRLVEEWRRLVSEK